MTVLHHVLERCNSSGTENTHVTSTYTRRASYLMLKPKITFLIVRCGLTLPCRWSSRVTRSEVILRSVSRHEMGVVIMFPCTPSQTFPAMLCVWWTASRLSLCFVTETLDRLEGGYRAQGFQAEIRSRYIASPVALFYLSLPCYARDEQPLVCLSLCLVSETLDRLEWSHWEQSFQES